MSGARRVLNGGKYENTIIDPIMGEYENSVLLEYSLAGKHLVPACSQNVIYHDRIRLAAAICTAWNKKFRSSGYRQILNDISKSLTQPLLEMQKEYGVTVKTEHIIRNMTDLYYQYGVYRKKYLKMIN